ncbi:HD-GYP domain-containing protein [Bacillus alveayuensis]|jgi:HD-GYP domain-containing protein (c-di-GMP phosphodiesterase class II)|uniref:HD-GYP domain-containing protein n=1 Tax=Aeribacillus alveayuensis TaxID=279215 RepID=UPI0005CD8EA8|nr:HD-GYP domain-containing protein [Bacillus alveayuensis]
MMRVKVSQLKEGCILAADVLGKSSKPIISKNTILTPFLLTVLKKFLVEDVYVKSVLVSGEPFIPNEIIENSQTQERETTEEEIISFYLKAVQQYKRIFQTWQSGLPVDIREVRDTIIPLLDKLIEAKGELFSLYRYTTKEDYLYHHAISVGLFAAFIAKSLGYDKGDYYQVALSGVLCDCGMSKIDPRLLTKSSALTSEEYKEIKQHTVYGYKMVQKLPTLQEGVKLAVLQHHERNDGSGYPFGLDEKKIHPYSKIVAVADVYHAMISERLYRAKQSPFKALEQLQADSFGKLSMEIVQVLLEHLTTFNIGTKVKLSNGEIAEIVFIHPDAPTRPMVKNLQTNEFVSLRENRNIHIEEVIS